MVKSNGLLNLEDGMQSLVVELIGQVLDKKYHIERQLGQGGMGAVYLATHLGTGRPVALKVIVPQFMTNEGFVERFKREARAAGLLRHPNVVDVTDFGFTEVDSGQIAYLVMEYLNGFSLGDMLKTKQSLPLNFVVDIVEQVCLAIGEAHDQGIVHRDLKPDNIWLEPNGRGGFNVKVLDFGLAKLRSADPLSVSVRITGNLPFLDPDTIPTIITKSVGTLEDEDNDKTQIKAQRTTSEMDVIKTATGGELTQAGEILGTPLYMSPEQCSGEELDARSDIYSLAVIVYQMLAGETPFTGDLRALMTGHMKGSPPPLLEKRPDTPKMAAALVMSALAKSPSERPSSAAAFSAAFQANASGESALLRRAIAIYSEHFSRFIQISFFGYTPMVAAIVAFFMVLLIPSLHTPAAVISVLLFFSLGQIVNNLVTGGIVVPLVEHLLESPLAPFEIQSLFAPIRKRFREYLLTSFLAVRSFMVITALPLIACLVLPLNPDTGMYWLVILLLMAVTALLLRGNFLSGKWLYAPITLWEKLEGQATIVRSKILIERLGGSLGRIFPLFIFAMLSVSVLTILLGWSLIKHLDRGISPAESAIEIMIAVLSVLLSVLLCTVLSPLIGIGYALFYLKARQAGSEKIKIN
jgi:serine/threonine protein kinase